ncbi:hypothetical protein Tco_0280729 [Tanacetum coccineum]
MPNTRSGASMTREEFEELVARRVAEELEAREAARTLEPLNENGDELEGDNGGNGNGNGGNGNGNGNGGNGNRNRNHGMNYGGFMPVARECTFQDFLKCKPHNFSGTEGVVELTRWFEKMKSLRQSGEVNWEFYLTLPTNYRTNHSKGNCDCALLGSIAASVLRNPARLQEAIIKTACANPIDGPKRSPWLCCKGVLRIKEMEKGWRHQTRDVGALLFAPLQTLRGGLPVEIITAGYYFVMSVEDHAGTLPRKYCPKFEESEPVETNRNKKWKQKTGKPNQTGKVTETTTNRLTARSLR